MPFVSPDYLKYIGPEKRAELYRNHVSLGYQPETHDELLLPDVDRYSSEYILGVAGGGKSGLLQNSIHADMLAGHAIIVLDPHGDLITNCLSQVPDGRLKDTYILDITDESYPVGINLFSTGKLTSDVERTRAVDRIMHVFEVLWPEVKTQQYLPLFLPSAIKVFLDNPGKTLVHMLQFFQDDTFRAAMLNNVTDHTLREFWEYEYNRRSETERRQRVHPLTNRLHTLFTGNRLVRNILGQPSTISFRRSTEAKQIIFVRLPTKDIPHVASLVGTIMLSQISNAIFSFGNMPEAQRPGVSLYVDEFSHFATTDFNELFSEARKFKARLTIAHQYRSQLPNFLRDSTMNARTKVCFQLTPEDGREMAHLFPSTEATVQPEDISEHPIHYLLTKTPDEPMVQTFVETYLRPLQGHKRGPGRVEMEMRGYAPSPFEVWSGDRSDNPRIADPTPYLDNLLYQVMVSGNPSLDIPADAVKGFGNGGRGFFKQARGLVDGDLILTMQTRFPKVLVVQAADGGLRWTRRPESDLEQLYHFIFYLRQVMAYLAERPIGKKTTVGPTEVGRMLSNLPRRAAFVRSGDTIGVIYTHRIAPALSKHQLFERGRDILEQTRAVYCHPRAEVEKLFMQPSNQPPGNSPISRWEEIE